MTVEELVFKIAEKAKTLGNSTINELRYSVGTANTYHGAITEGKHKTRGELLEELLLEEFLEKAKDIDTSYDPIDKA